MPFLDETIVKNTPVSNDRYCLFYNPATKRNFHAMNYYLYRSPALRQHMRFLWNNKKNITNFNTLDGANPDQRIVQRLNFLFRNLESHGPNRREFPNFKYDKVNDMYHCHLKDGRQTYVVMWEVDEEKRIINIVDYGIHENFKFERRHHKQLTIDKIEAQMINDKPFQEQLIFLTKQDVDVPAPLLNYKGVST